MTVYQAIEKVSEELAAVGIGKTRKNEQQGFKFRGIDEVLNTLAPMLPKHHLVVLPRILKRECAERTTAKGAPLFYVNVEAAFDFVSTVDGSTHTVTTFGEAMDTADKATNKAMSVAYKYAVFLSFCVPVEAMAEDADTVTHIVEPMGYRDWLTDLTAMSETADIDTFRDTYRSSLNKFRHYLEEHQRPTLDALVERAKQNAPLPVL